MVSVVSHAWLVGRGMNPAFRHLTVTLDFSF